MSLFIDEVMDIGANLTQLAQQPGYGENRSVGEFSDAMLHEVRGQTAETAAPDVLSRKPRMVVRPIAVWAGECALKPLKRSAFNLRHQLKVERVQRLNGALHFAKICDSGFSRNALV